MSTQLPRKILLDTGLRGAVLQTFGTGNAPTTQEFLIVISDAVQSGTVIVNVTRCLSGEVELGLYSASAGLLSRGVVGGMDMTAEAALTKLMVVLGSESNADLAADKMQVNLKGEQRQNIFNLHFEAGQLSVDDNAVVRVLRPMVHGLDRYQPMMLQQAVLRVFGLETLDGSKGRIEFKIYLDRSDADKSTMNDASHFLGSVSKRFLPDSGPENVIVNISNQVRSLVDNAHQNTLTLVNMGLTSFNWSKLQIDCFTSQ